MWGFCSSFKNVDRRRSFEEDLQRCMSPARRSTRDIFIRDVRRSGRRFPERGCILERQIFRFAKLILRDRCSTSYDLASLFRGRCSTLGRWNGKIAKHIGTTPSALHSAFRYFKEVSQNCFVCFVVAFETWGNLAELLSFWRCQVPSSKCAEVSQNCCVLDVVKFKTWGSLAELLRFRACR